MIEVAHPDRWATSILEDFVTVYLGMLGRMIPIYSTPSAQLETEERYTFSTTLEGRRKAQARPIGRRTWGLNAQFADPAEHSLLSQFANGAWGSGPFIFVSAEASHTNLMTPAASMCIPVDPLQAQVFEGGPVDLPGVGWVPRSYLSGSPTTFVLGREIYPVDPSGGPVTAQVFVQGENSRARLNWYDAQKNYLGSTASTVSGSNLGFTRSWVTAVPPAGAAGVGVGALTSIVVAAPSLTWGAGRYEWSVGAGCLESVVHGVNNDQVLAVPGHTFSNVGFTVTEVG